jgi:hypothetical protein
MLCSSSQLPYVGSSNTAAAFPIMLIRERGPSTWDMASWQRCLERCILSRQQHCFTQFVGFIPVATVGLFSLPLLGSLHAFVGTRQCKSHTLHKCVSCWIHSSDIHRTRSEEMPTIFQEEGSVLCWFLPTNVHGRLRQGQQPIPILLIRADVVV